MQACSEVNLPSDAREPDTIISMIELPEGFSVEVYADVPDARSLALGQDNTVFVGNRRNGNVYAIIDNDQDYNPDRTVRIASDMNMPNGLAYRDRDLYVAEVSRVIVFRDIENKIKNMDPAGEGDLEYEVLFDGYPDDTGHGWKFISFSPDGNLFVPVGAPCNICEKEDPYASITRLDRNFSSYEVYARGVRNTVGFDWHPETGELWFTDNGRDWLGDNLPPDELNHAPEQGMNFGYPYCHGNDIQDPEFDSRQCSEFQGPEIELGPHVAALGMMFYTGSMFPEEYSGDIFIAEHGSWNREVPIGYRVMHVSIEDGEAVSKEVFAQGWLQGEETMGRPVDVLQMPDGSMLVSDDHAGSIYRITYKG
ncbi:sorbosone dehydrogenase family protein [Candidatus Woesearchaeota archaeon]|nr:sorbosone dehydrogenase family protein [Candidatus Woesearchaeota archaeon]